MPSLGYSARFSLAAVHVDFQVDGFSCCDTGSCGMHASVVVAHGL